MDGEVGTYACHHCGDDLRLDQVVDHLDQHITQEQP